jgi:hypothetical protein
LTGLVIYLLLRRRQKGKGAAGAPKPTPPSPPSAAQKLAVPIRVMRCFLLLFQRETGGA